SAEARRAAKEKQRKADFAAAEKSNKAAAQKSSGGAPRNPFKFKKLEDRIMKLEETLKQLNESMTEEKVYSNATTMTDVQFRIAEVERELEDANEEWMNWG
ncbi:MAG: hypothetical protein ACI87O_002143, partial [Planctomycetota bacterium]